MQKKALSALSIFICSKVWEINSKQAKVQMQSLFKNLYMERAL